MPRAVPVIKFDPEGKPLVVNIEFPTLQVVSYTLTLFEATSNSTVLRETGNNVNPEDDRYTLPTPPAVNDGRLLQFDATFIDPGDKPNASCRASLLTPLRRSFPSAPVRAENPRLWTLLVQTEPESPRAVVQWRQKSSQHLPGSIHKHFCLRSPLVHFLEGPK